MSLAQLSPGCYFLQDSLRHQKKGFANEVELSQPQLKLNTSRSTTNLCVVFVQLVNELIGKSWGLSCAKLD